MLETFYEYVVQFFHSIDYTAVGIMMAIEASFIPFPSEIPMIAVGMQSASGTMNPVIGLVVALIGVWVGTTINYLIGYYIGDAFVERFGKYFFIKKADYHRAQELFNQDSGFYTFFGRLIPVVRQLISIPAGMARMPYMRFIALSLAGSTIWLTILIALGYFIGENTDLIKKYTLNISLVIIGIALLVWYLRHRHKKYTKKVSEEV